MTTAYTITGLVCFAVFFAELSGIPQRFGFVLRRRKNNPANAPRRVKPFDCAMCLAFWVTLSWFYFNDAKQDSFFHASVASVAAWAVAKAANKIR